MRLVPAAGYNKPRPITVMASGLRKASLIIHSFDCWLIAASKLLQVYIAASSAAAYKTEMPGKSACPVRVQQQQLLGRQHATGAPHASTPADAQLLPHLFAKCMRSLEISRACLSCDLRLYNCTYVLLTPLYSMHTKVYKVYTKS